MRLSKTRGDAAAERLILIGMITDPKVLHQASQIWTGRMFANRWSNMIGGWCVEYHRTYQKPPGRRIEAKVDEWAAGDVSKEMVSQVERFMGELSEEFESKEPESSQFIIDKMADHFTRVKLQKLKDELEDELEAGQPSLKVVEKVETFRRVEAGVEAFKDWLDPEHAMSVLHHDYSSIVRFPGDLGVFFGDSLHKGGFLTYMGPEKRGKSFWLLETAYRALVSRCRVAYFEAGDMDESQILRRLTARILRRPMKSKTIRIPRKIVRDEETGAPEVSFDDRDHGPLTEKEIQRGFERFIRGKVKGKDRIRGVEYAANTLSADDILVRLQNWEAEDGWRPDVVIVDYADILAGAPGLEGRDRINDVWINLRKLARLRDCLVITATQADARSYEANTLGMSNFSEDKRKLGHVSGMVGLQQSEDERRDQIWRLNWIVRRGEVTLSDPVFVAGCLDISAPAIVSTF